jgi:hypothetical protein
MNLVFECTDVKLFKSIGGSEWIGVGITLQIHVQDVVG